MKLNVNLPGHGYPIYIERGSLTAAGQRIPVHRRTCIVTDDGIPAKWVNTVKDTLPGSFVVTIPHGEGSKNLATMQQVLEQMAEAGMTRKDAVVAVGGGVCGDLAGFCAAVYMRGIDFYNIPTTVLSQVDSSVGGKTAVEAGSVGDEAGDRGQDIRRQRSNAPCGQGRAQHQPSRCGTGRKRGGCLGKHGGLRLDAAQGFPRRGAGQFGVIRRQARFCWRRVP